MNTPYILNFTPTGMVPTRAMTPHVPLDPEEIAREVIEGVELGVNMVHLHARDPQTGEPTWHREIYGEMIGRIRAQVPELVICVSTSGRNFPEFEKRADVLALDGPIKPDFASLTLGSLNFPRQASVNSPEMIQALAARMRERGIRPELEAFDLGMLNYARYLADKGLIAPPYYFNLLLGNIDGAQATPLYLGLMIRELPDGAVWSAAGIGEAQLTMNAIGLAAGGGVRVGLEDNIFYDDERTRLATNGDLIRRVVEIGKSLGRRPMTLSKARQCLLAR